ncbi:ABC transporter substrate-binding protein [Alcaligenaceae bacterium]|nr:ABC transporter substrate-binding protein [Alcaligenaceae bacterium]
MIKKTHLLLGTLALAISNLAVAQYSSDAIRIGFITDLSGPYADNDGPGGAEAIRMAVEDFGGKVNGLPIEVRVADHQSKADLGAATARSWLDNDNVNMIVGGSNSAVQLAINQLLKDKRFIFMNVGGGSTRFTNEDCTPYTVQYHYNTKAQARAVGSAIGTKEGMKWYLLTADYAFGHDLEKDAKAVIESSNGQVLGAVRHPFGTSDFASFILQAQSSGAEVLGLANAGSDLLNSIKAARDFGLTDSMRMAAFVMYVNNIHGMGLEDAQGLLLSEPWYWDQSDESREFAKRYYEKTKRMPNGVQAADYSATMTYLTAVKAAGTDNPDAIMEQLKKMEINDMYTKGGDIRDDGQMVHDYYLYEVKKPSESEKPWDYMRQTAVVPGEVAFGPLSESTCSLLKP